MLFLFMACGVHIRETDRARGPVVVFKTKKDYRDKVSVQLSPDGKTITAFPAPSDVLFQKPLELINGYFLKRMVGDAYLSLSIDDYASSLHSYTSEELLDLVIDRDPFLEIYECSKSKDGDTASINKMIRKGELKNCSSFLK